MTKDESETLKIRGKIIPQWLVTILASLVTSLIAGYFTLQASVQPIYLQISVTQTAQAQFTSVPTTTNQQTATTQPVIATPASPSNTNNSQSATFGDGIVLLFKKYYLLIAIWLFIAFANKQQRSILGEQLSALLSKPVIFIKDESGSIVLYPRMFLEQTTNIINAIPSSNFSHSIKSALLDYIKLKSQFQFTIFLGYTIRLILFCIFFSGTAIAITSSLESMSVINNIPEWLTNYDLAITFGTIFALVFGVWVLVEPNAIISANFRNNPAWKGMIKLLSMSMFLFSLLIMFVLALARLYHIGVFPLSSEKLISQIISIAFASIIPLNNMIASLLLVADAITGLVIIATSLIWIFTYIAEYAFVIVGSVIMFILDFLLRFLAIYIYVTSFLLITPIDTILGKLTMPLNKNAT